MYSILWRTAQVEKPKIWRPKASLSPSIKVHKDGNSLTQSVKGGIDVAKSDNVDHEKHPLAIGQAHPATHSLTKEGQAFSGDVAQ